MNRQKIRKANYLAAFAITVLVFIIGILVGNFFSDSKINQLEILERDIKLDSLGTELQYLILAETPCSFLNSSLITEQLYELSEKLTYMENQLGFDNEHVLGVKEEYSLLQIRHWLLMKRSNDECDNEVSFVLYFYSNKGDCPRCEQQGQVLTHLRRKYPNVNIYAFDINIDNPALNTLKKLYIQKNETPVLIINGETHYGFKDSGELHEIVFGGKEVIVS